MTSINFSGRAAQLRQLLFEEKKKKVSKEEEGAAAEKVEETVKPEPKAITASVSELIASYNLGELKLKPIVIKPEEPVVTPDTPKVPEDTTVEPEEPATTPDITDNSNEDNGIKELKAQGFTQADIDEYFEKTENGEYKIKSGIKKTSLNIKGLLASGLSGGLSAAKTTSQEITTIEELRDYCGADKRKALIDEGWTDELIDKCFIKDKNKITGKSTYRLNPEKYSYEPECAITKADDGTRTINIKGDFGEETITVKADGTYESNFVQAKGVASNAEELLDRGFTEAQIDEWFTKKEYGLKIKTNLIFNYRDFDNIDDLAAYIGADSRSHLTKDYRLPDELVDKYFELKQTGADGSYTYELKFEGKWYESGESMKSEITNEIIIENEENGTITTIRINPDGTATENVKENTQVDNQKDVAAKSAEELLAQGFTQADIDKYFYVQNNQYYLKSNISAKVSTLDDLKEFCGANYRNNLKSQGLTDEIIDKYYNKTTDSTGKTTYREQGIEHTISHYADTTVLTRCNWKSETGIAEEVTIKQDGTYTVLKYTSDQITDKTETYSMLRQKGFTDSQIKEFFTEKDGLYTLRESLVYNFRSVYSIADLVQLVIKDKDNN